MAQANEALIQKIVRDTITTGTLASGGLLPDDVADAFLTAFEEQTEFSRLHSWRRVDTTSGKINKLTIGSRILRAMSENTNPTETQSVDTTQVSYDNEDVRLDYEITEKTIRQNIAKEGFETLVFNGMSEQYSVDIGDMAWNGDTDVDPEATDALFLVINDGWLKKLPAEGAGAVAGAAINDGDIHPDHFYEAVDQLTEKWAKRLNEFKFVMNPRVRYRLARQLSQRGTGLGDIYIETSSVNEIAGVGIVVDANLPVTTVVLAIPAHLAITISREMTLRYTNTSDDAVRMDKRIYAMFAAFDPICLWPDAAVLITGLNA